MAGVPDIRMSELVRQLLGAEMIRHTLAAPLARARCPFCLEPVPPTGPVNVVVRISGLDQAITFAHLGCAPSAVMRARSSGVDLVAATGMTMTAMVMQADDALLSALVGERKSPAYLHSRTPGGDLTDVGVADALNRGLELVPALDDVPSRLLDWPATVTDSGSETYRLLINPTDLFYDGAVELPPAWREITKMTGWCVLYTGTGLSHPTTGDLTMQSLLDAAARGTLAGARLRITWTTAR
jgi:hypothetical protein